MYKQLGKKCFLILGLFLFFTLLTPLFESHIALASSIDKMEKVEYRLNLKSITLVKDKSFTLRAYNLDENATISFKSDNSEIASVDNNGIITANMVGVTTITATIKNDNEAVPLTCEVTVGPPAFSVKITKSRLIIGVNRSDLLNVILKPTNTAEVARFSSYNSSIASVSIGGRVTAKALGLTYVFAEIDATNIDGNHRFSICTVIVTSTEDASLLEAYFNQHSELDLISRSQLSMALAHFFNAPTDDTGITLAEKASDSNLIEALDNYLNEEFDLESLRADETSEDLNTNTIN